MSSGGSFSSYSSEFKLSKDLHSKDKTVRLAACSARSDRIESFVGRLGDEDIEIPMRDVQGVHDEKFVRLGITKPAVGVKRAWVVLIDNSGSNRLIAHKLRQDSGYLTAFLNSLDPSSQLATIYFSDHCDGIRGLMQEIDFVHPNEEGDKIICSTLHHIHDVSGGDEAEAIECVLWRACDIDFADAEERHLILVTDVVAHGMGMESDDGCPEQRDWKKSLEKVRKTFTSFVVVGSGDDIKTGKLQRQFLASDRVDFDLIDLSSIKEPKLRLGMAANAILFLIARQVGKQAMELFLSALYEKWIKEPLFGLKTDKLAKDMIQRLGKFLEYPQAETHDLLKKVTLEE